MAKSGTPDFRKIGRKRRRQKQQARRQGNEKMIQRLNQWVPEKYKIIRNPEGVKMSEVLLDFIEPYEHVADTDDAMHKLVTTALVAWNTALMPEEDRQESLEKFAETLPEDLVEDFYAIVGGMIERKQKYFANYTRLIVDYQLTDMGDEYHLSVISTMDREPAEDR